MKIRKLVLSTGLLLSALLYILVFHKELFLEGLIPFSADGMRFYFPSWSIGKRMLLEGGYFLWDSYRAMGQPYAANPSTQGFYPFRLISFFYGYENYQKISVFFHTILAVVFSYKLARILFADRRTAIIASLGMGFNGFFISRIGYTGDFSAFAWTPLILYLLIKEKAFLLGLSLMLQWLAGFPPLSILTLIFVAVCSIVYRRTKSAYLGFLFMMGLSAFQMVPFLELLKLSDRPVFLDELTAFGHSISPKLFYQNLFTAPAFWPMTWTNTPYLEIFYMGPILTLLFLYGLLTSLTKKGLTWVLSLTSLCAMILSFGKFLPIYKYIPGITFFRFPSNWTFLFTMTAILLSCIGFENIKSKSLKSILILVVAADLLSFNKIVWPFRVQESFFTESHVRLSDLTSPPDISTRVFHTPALIDKSLNWGKSLNEIGILKGVLIPSYAAGLGYKEISSHNNLTMKSNAAYVKRAALEGVNSPLLDAAGTKVIVALTSEGVKSDDPIQQGFRTIINAHPKPRVFFSEGKGDAKIIQDHPGTIKVETNGEGLLVFSESYYPGWIATVDGKNKKISLFEDYFSSVEIENGAHVVEFKYRPISFFIGIIISLLTLLFGLLFHTPLLMKGIMTPRQKVVS